MSDIVAEGFAVIGVERHLQEPGLDREGGVGALAGIRQVVELRGGQALFRGVCITGLAPAAAAGAEGEFPVSLTDRKASADAVMDHMVMQRRLVLAEQRGEKAHAVLSGVVGQFRLENGCAGGEEIGVADGLCAL